MRGILVGNYRIDNILKEQVNNACFLLGMEMKYLLARVAKDGFSRERQIVNKSFIFHKLGIL